jgi:hypothetical protein
MNKRRRKKAVYKYYCGDKLTANEIKLIRKHLCFINKAHASPKSIPDALNELFYSRDMYFPPKSRYSVF